MQYFTSLQAVHVFNLFLSNNFLIPQDAHTWSSAGLSVLLILQLYIMLTPSERMAHYTMLTNNYQLSATATILIVRYQSMENHWHDVVIFCHGDIMMHGA